MSTGPLLGLELDRDAPLGRQIERQVRELVRSGALEVGDALPSTRTLAADLRVSRGVVVGAYTQLAAEGSIAVRRGAAPTVAAAVSAPGQVENDPNLPFARATCLPDFALFPRAQWLTVVRSSLQGAAGQDFAYGEPQGASDLRRRLPAFLARTRGVVGTSDRTCIFAGSSQALFVLASVLRATGATRIAVEDPSHRWRTTTLAASGLELVPVRVDEGGLRVDELPDVPAVVVSPEHQFPTGAALAPERRRALLDWAAVGDRVVIEHDYDGHFRYDRAPAAALQGLAPERVAYVGSASALLAPTVRVGWAVLPGALVAPVVEYLFATSIAAPRLTQLALAGSWSAGSSTGTCARSEPRIAAGVRPSSPRSRSTSRKHASSAAPPACSCPCPFRRTPTSRRCSKPLGSRELAWTASTSTPRRRSPPEWHSASPASRSRCSATAPDSWASAARMGG